MGDVLDWSLSQILLTLAMLSATYQALPTTENYTQNYVGIMEDEMENAIVYWGYIGIMGKKWKLL